MKTINVRWGLKRAFKDSREAARVAIDSAMRAEMEAFIRGEDFVKGTYRKIAGQRVLTTVGPEFTMLGSFGAAGQKLDYALEKLRISVRSALPWFLRGLV